MIAFECKNGSDEAFLLALNAELKNEKKKTRSMLFRHAANGPRLVRLGPGGVGALDKPRRKLNRIQERSIGRYLQASALLHHYVHKNVIGRAWQTANPKKDFSLQVCSYAYK